MLRVVDRLHLKGIVRVAAVAPGRSKGGLRAGSGSGSRIRTGRWTDKTTVQRRGGGWESGG